MVGLSSSSGLDYTTNGKLLCPRDTRPLSYGERHVQLRLIILGSIKVPTFVCKYINFLYKSLHTFCLFPCLANVHVLKPSKSRITEAKFSKENMTPMLLSMLINASRPRSKLRQNLGGGMIRPREEGDFIFTSYTLAAYSETEPFE